MGLLTVNAKEIKLTVDWDGAKKYVDIIAAVGLGLGILAITYVSAMQGNIEAMSQAYLGF